MKSPVLGLVCCVFSFASAAGAQTKISGAVQCTKPEPVSSVDVGDRPGHTMTLNKGTCTWTTPMEIAGAKTQTDAVVYLTETTPTRITSSGAILGTVDNGDKMFVSIHSSAPLKDGKPGAGQGTFMFTGGTGKLKGLKGKGTYTLAFGADGTATADVQGEYEMPATSSR